MIINKKFILIIISIIIINSAICFVVPTIINNHDNKNLIRTNALKKDIPLNTSINQLVRTNTLIRNLTYVHEYIINSVIERQKMLLLSITGGSLNSTIKYKESQIAWFNNSTGIKKNRYTKEAKATIENSRLRLIDEDNTIEKIIPILINHSYTYGEYLNSAGFIIPNIDFFTSNNSLNKNNLIQNTNTILNDSYNIKKSYASINSISLVSEEQIAGLKSISIAGSGVLAAIFKNFTFSSKIITFNKTSNKYEFATPTKKIENTKSLTYNKKHSLLFRANNWEISKSIHSNLNNILYFDSNNYALTKINSIYNKTKIQEDIITNNKPIPKYFNTHFADTRAPDIKFNQITQYTHNKLLYTLMYAIPSITFIIYSTFVTALVAEDIRKNGISLRENVYTKTELKEEKKANKILRIQERWKRTNKENAPTAAQIQEAKEINARNKNIVQRMIDTQREKREKSKITTDKKEPVKTTDPQVSKVNIKIKNRNVDNIRVSEVQNNLKILQGKYLELKRYSEILNELEGTIDIEAFISTINGYINEIEQLGETLVLNPEIKQDLNNDVANWREWTLEKELELNNEILAQNHSTSRSLREIIQVPAKDNQTNREIAEIIMKKYELERVRNSYEAYLYKEYGSAGRLSGSLECIHTTDTDTSNLPNHTIVSPDSITTSDSNDFEYTYSELEGYTKLDKSKKDETGIESLLVSIETHMEG